MDRKIVYPGAIPLETDVLLTGKFAMVAMARLTQDMLGQTGTVAAGFATTPTAPASMQVSVASGDILSLQNVDGTAFGDVPADTNHAILKQGIALDPTLLTLTAPAAAGQSIVYLVEVGYQDSDTDNVVLPYYNAANPAQPFTGPAGAGTAQPTTRKGLAVVTFKAGIAAATGSQVAPAPDVGFVGLYTVTVANGQTTITSANIAQVAGAPYLAGLLNSHHGGVAGQAPKINLSNAAEVQGVLPAANVDPAVSGGSSSAAAARASVGVNVAGGSNVALTGSQAAYGIIVLTGALTANINVILPSGSRWEVINNTTGAYTVTCVNAAGGGTGYIVRQGFCYKLYTDSANVNPLGPQFFWGTAAASTYTLQANENYQQYS